MALTHFRIVEACIAELRAALDAGIVSSVELVAACLNRIAYYDRHGIRLNATLSPVAPDGNVTLEVSGTATAAGGIDQLALFVNGMAMAVKRLGTSFTAELTLPSSLHQALHSRWRAPYGSIVTAVARDASGACAGAFAVVGGIA